MLDSILLLAALVSAGNGVTVDVLPAAPRFERLRSHLSLQCDFRLTNTTASPVTLVKLTLEELDDEGVLVRRRFVDQNGTAPSVQTVLARPVPAGGAVHVYNPFHRFEPGAPPARLDFHFTFQSGGTPWTETLTIEGRVYETRTPLRLPLDERLLVWDGHDYLSHHRRLNWDHPVVQSLGFEANNGRYALDLVVIGEDGSETSATPMGPEDWHGWGAPIVAPGGGRVVAAVDDFPDNGMQNGRVVVDSRVTPQDMATLAGNYVVIDHGNGEFSLLGHLRRGSVKVEIGQRVESGTPLAEMGFSGSTSHVHLHYQLQDSPHLTTSHGLPGAIARYRLYRGSRSEVVVGAPIETGDIVEHVDGP